MNPKTGQRLKADLDTLGLDSAAYEPQHYPLGLLSCCGVRRQSQAHCADLCRSLSDSYYQVFDQEMD
jgi:hypothetical protein